MDEQLQHYLTLLAQGKADTIAPGELEALQRRYPFFTQPALSRLREADRLSEDEMTMLREELSLTASDIAAIGEMMERGSDKAPFYPAEEHQERMSTESAIDTFLDRYGPADVHETELLEKLIFNPVAPDYTASLEALETAAPDSDHAPAESDRDRLIDAFIAKNSPQRQPPATDEIPIEMPESTAQPEPQAAPVPHATLEQPDNHALLSESLAKIYIRRGRYEKAFEIIHSLSLNYPEKSVYFADQLRFLHKAMQIKQRQSARKHQ